MSTAVLGTTLPSRGIFAALVGAVVHVDIVVSVGAIGSSIRKGSTGRRAGRGRICRRSGGGTEWGRRYDNGCRVAIPSTSVAMSYPFGAVRLLLGLLL